MPRFQVRFNVDADSRFEIEECLRDAFETRRSRDINIREITPIQEQQEDTDEHD